MDRVRTRPEVYPYKRAAIVAAVIVAATSGGVMLANIDFSGLATWGVAYA